MKRLSAMLKQLHAMVGNGLSEFESGHVQFFYNEADGCLHMERLNPHQVTMLIRIYSDHFEK